MATMYITQKRRVDQKLWNTLDEHLLTFVEHGVMLAVSGGPDSRALLEAVASWPRRHRGRFLVVAIDHGVRKESSEEARLVTLRAKRLGFDAEVVPLRDVTSYSEADLRKKRYEIFSALALEKNLFAIVTAHHGDDNAEGYFMALMGAGGGELGCSMTEVEAWGHLTICRPFLSLTKDDLLLSLTLGHHTDFVRDSLDEARRGKRAFVRYEIFPEVHRHVPNFAPRLAMFSRTQHQQRDVLDKLAKSLIIWHDNYAVVSLISKPDSALIISALWQILRKISSGKDLRAAGVVINGIARDIAANDFRKIHEKAGLDPPTNGFNVKHLDIKRYQFPGAVAFRASSEILVRRI